MIVLGLDTATAATAVALLDDARPDAATERRHEPAAGERPGHAAQLLTLAAELLAAAGLRFADVDRIAVGVGPGTFTGLRIGVASARALAQGSGAELVGVSTLRALAVAAEPAAPAGSGVLAVIDARRGEAFAAGWRAGAAVLEPAALAPAELARRVARRAGHGWRWGTARYDFEPTWKAPAALLHQRVPRSITSAPERSASSRSRRREARATWSSLTTYACPTPCSPATSPA